MYKISLVIATYNRCESLRVTLNSLLELELDGKLEYEVIVVDNNSKDKTFDVVEGLKSYFNGRLVYLYEIKQGKSYALNKGISAAKGEIIALTDDDCVVDKNWLKSISEIFSLRKPDLLSAKVIPRFNSVVPKWLNIDAMRGPIVYHHLEDRYIENSERIISVCGSNLSFLKETYNKYGGFSYSGRGEDGELCRRWVKLGARVAYDPGPVVYHNTDPSRLTKNYFRKWYFLCGKHYSIFRKFENEQHKLFLDIPFWVYGKFISTTVDFMKSMMIFDRDIFTKEIWVWYYAGIIFEKFLPKNLLESLR